MSTNHDEAGGSTPTSRRLAGGSYEREPTAVEPVTDAEIGALKAKLDASHAGTIYLDMADRLVAERNRLNADFTAFAEQQRGLNQELIKLEAERDALREVLGELIPWVDADAVPACDVADKASRLLDAAPPEASAGSEGWGCAGKRCDQGRHSTLMCDACRVADPARNRP